MERGQGERVGASQFWVGRGQVELQVWVLVDADSGRGPVVVWF